MKSHLAGKRGKCPQCGSRFQIPADSVPDDDSGGSGSGGSGVATANAPMGAPTGVPSRRSVATPNAASPGPTKGSTRAAANIPAATQSAVDPGRVRSDVWYVRTREGQFGPTEQAEVEAWVRDGRIAAGNWLWQDGWETWQRAEDVFPALQSPAQSATPASAAQPIPAGRTEIQLDTQAPHHGRVSARRRKGAQRRWAAVVVLSVASLLLLAALAYVVRTTA